MNWRARFLPSNNAEIGCFTFLLMAVILFFVTALGYQTYFLLLSILLVLGYWVLKFGNELLTIYEITRFVAYFVSFLMELVFAAIAFALVGLGVLAAWALGFLLDGRPAQLLGFILAVVVAYLIYTPLKQLRSTICEQWFGWQRKEKMTNG